MTLTGHIVGTKGNTGRGIASIVENADYTITINLTDGSSYTTAPIAGFTAVEFDENYDLVVTKTDGTTETVETDIADYNALLKGYKDDAETAATNANTYQGWAQDYANNAQAQAGYASTYKQAAYDSKVAAGTSESNAGTQALKSEGYAVGKQNGTDVSSGSDYYHNNAKYYSDMAHIDATDASDSQSSASGSASTASAQALKSEGYAVGKQNGTDVTSGSDYYQNNSKYYKEQAATSASSASTNALKAEGFAVGEQNGTAVSSGSPYYENNAEYYAGEAADSATAAAASAASLTVDSAMSTSSTNPVQNKVIKGALDTKAEIDGAYESMTVGNAEQLVSTVFVNDEEPYNFRTSGGSADIGDREYDTIVGGTVAWNQLAQNGNFATKASWTYWRADYAVANNEATITNTNTDGSIYQDVPCVAGHKYIVSANVKNGDATNIRFIVFSSTVATVTGTSYETAQKIIATATTGTFRLQFTVTGATGQKGYIKNVYVIDLTQMFGTTIADYIYSLEQANTGAGVAWFRKLFPKPYYAYNTGELMSVNTSAHNTVGFNAWDEEWELGDIAYNTGQNKPSSSRIRSKNYIRVIPNAAYYIKSPSNLGLRLYDEDKNFISYASRGNDTYVIPSDVGYMRFIVETTTYDNDICINLSWDGERDGEYEEYVKHSYPLDSSLTLRGIPKLDASNNLYYDGDTYESDGTVTRKYGIVDLGTLTWNRNTTNQYYAPLPTAGTQYTGNHICTKYVASARGAYDGNADKAISITGVNVWVRDTAYPSATGTEFKTAMSDVYLVYELATPTTESADPFQSPQIVDDFGTEEYVDYAMSEGDRDVAIPVGHVTKYTNNLRAKLEMSPNSPDGAGDYLVRQTNGINEYVSLASNATIQDIIARIEALEGGGE